MNERFDLPPVGPPSLVRFPPVARTALDNGVHVWSVVQDAAPVVSVAVVLDGGTSSDPVDRPGLASLTGALATEGAGRRDALAMADALARIGAHLDVQPAADVMTVTLTTVTHHAPAAFDLLADIVRRPRLAADDFVRVRELRLSRLRQTSRVASTVADRVLIRAVFGLHPYGHGALGTTNAVEATTADDVRAHWEATWAPGRATVIVSGDMDAETAIAETSRVFGDWSDRRPVAPREPVPVPAPRPADGVLVVHRPGAAQAELRVGQLAPPRNTPDYHALVALNALLGGQFTSRINRNLRERRAITYGARSAFDLRRAGGLFSCDTSVQADAAGVAIAEILREYRAVTEPGSITQEELDLARASLTRGYVRHFETTLHLARALVEMTSYGLQADAFDRFVPTVLGLTVDDVSRAALDTLTPDRAVVVVVADLDAHGAALESLGLDLIRTEAEF